MYGPQEQGLISPEAMAKRQAAMEYEARTGAIRGGAGQQRPAMDHEMRHGAITGVASQLRQRPAMESLMEQLVQNLCMLEDTVATLDGRTQPIRNQVPQVEKNTTTACIPSGSPIGATVAHQAMRIQTLNARIQTIISELEI